MDESGKTRLEGEHAYGTAIIDGSGLLSDLNHLESLRYPRGPERGSLIGRDPPVISCSIFLKVELETHWTAPNLILLKTPIAESH